MSAQAFLIHLEAIIGKDPVEKTQYVNEIDTIEQARSYLIENDLDFDTKTAILYSLFFLYPNRPELYYYMGYIHAQNPKTCSILAVYWFKAGITHFEAYRAASGGVPHPYELENWLDLLKTLFEKGYIKIFQSILDTNCDVIQSYVDQKNIRIIHVLAAFYIKTNQLRRADTMYSILLDPEIPKEPELEYQIQNNSLILYSRMAKFEELQELLKRNLTICQSMGNLDGVNQKTKQNLFCSNMLQYDYVFHNPEDRRSMCSSLVEKFFPVRIFSGFRVTKTKIHIGYVSADILHHAVSNFILPILENHDPSKFEIFLFMSRYHGKLSTSPEYEAIRKKCTLINIDGLATEEVVQKIRQSSIDVLFDLHGYTEHNRLDVFAQNPAPIQVSYLGFPNTVGSSNILRYRITDAIADPVDSKQWWAEKLVRLPGGFLLYRSIAQLAPIGPSRSFHPWIIFGAVNRESKNSPEVLACWREILEHAPHTKLLIKLSTTEDDEIHMEKYRTMLGQEDRLMFAKYGSTEDYFSLFSNIDILLDCFPYSGTTTTCNALYNSIPVVTLRHPDLHSHNVSSSLLHHIGFPELIADSRADYVDRAVGLSKDLERLYEYRDRGTIHRRFVEHMNPVRFMKEYEGAIQSIVEDESSRFV
jgi:predicted O-linked N-acetylglucosamine transferase (SPINDLY family)